MTPAVPRPSRLARIALAVLAATTLLIGIAGANDARAARGMELALQDDAVFVQGKYGSRSRAYRQLRALGVTRLKVNVLWAYVMPESQWDRRTKPDQINWDFSEYDRAIDEAARNGIRVHAALSGPAPRWATGNKRKPSGDRPNSRYFGEFAAVAAEHFKGRVDRYSIWNEPNWRTWLGPIKRQASLYRSLYIRGYKAIKSADRRAKVLIGETSPSRTRGRSQSPMAFLRSLACVNKKFRRVRRCAVLRADGYAHHPYDFRRSPTTPSRNPDDVTMANLSTLTRGLDRLSRAGRLRKNGRGRMPVYLTEYGYFSTGRRAVKKRVRTRWLSQAYTVALRNGRVKSQLQYLLNAPPRRASTFNLALLNNSGRKKYPQYNTLRRWYVRNRGRVKRPRGSISLPSAPAQPTT